MSRPKLVLCDIDGTLANRGKITERTFAAIRALADADIRFAVATGRAAGLLYPMDDHDYQGVAICDNGAFTYDVGNNDVLACELIEGSVVGDVAAAISHAHPELMLGLSRITPHPRAMYSEPRQVELFDFGQKPLEIAEFGACAAAKMWAVNREYRSSEIAAKVAPIVGQSMEISWSSEGGGLVEMTARGVTKASGCAALALRWRIDVDDIVAIGDMTNDLEMLQWAGTAVVPENGNADAKARADVLIGHIEDDGIATYLESLVK
ncbi:MAG: HAD family hydrolase [Cumulibacter sp.]